MKHKVQRSRVHESLLQHGLEHRSVKVTGGQIVNNRLRLDYDHLRETNLFWQVSQSLVKLARPYEPEFVVGVPDGATGYARFVANELDATHIKLKKRSYGGIKAVRFASDEDEYYASEFNRGVVIEDVVDRRAGILGVLAIEELGAKVVAAVAVFDRGIPGQKVDIGIPIESVAAEPIPAQIPHGSVLLRYMRK